MKFKTQRFYPQIFLLLCCLFWYFVVMTLGVFESSITPKNGVLPFTFNWWESTSFDNHLLLGNYLENEALNGSAYTTYTYPFYLVNYFILAPFHHLFHISYEKAQNILPYVNVFFFAVVIYWIKKRELKLLIRSNNLYFQFLVFLVTGLLITNSLPWTSMLLNNLENFHMFISILFCLLSIFCIKGYETKKKDKAFLIIGMVISCITPIYFPAWVLCYIYTEDTLVIRKTMLINITIVIFSNIINYLLPLWAAQSLHLQSSSSSLFFRTGLDGSKEYFNSILSVIYAPSSAQQTSSTILIIVSTLLLKRVLKNKAKLYFKQLLFLIIPFLTTIILFPQFSSIHMYFVELLVVIPCIFMLCYWMINVELITQLKTKQYSMSIIFFALLIMSQLLEVASHFCSLRSLAEKHIPQLF